MKKPEPYGCDKPKGDALKTGIRTKEDKNSNQIEREYSSQVHHVGTELYQRYGSLAFVFPIYEACSTLLVRLNNFVVSAFVQRMIDRLNFVQ